MFYNNNDTDVSEAKAKPTKTVGYKLLKWSAEPRSTEGCSLSVGLLLQMTSHIIHSYEAFIIYKHD